MSTETSPTTILTPSSPKITLLNTQKTPGWAVVIMAMLAVLIVSVNVLWWIYLTEPGGNNTPGSTVNGVAAGRAFAPALIESFASAYEAAADANDKEISQEEVQKQAKITFDKHRTDSFMTIVAPQLEKVIKPGLEPATPDQRAAESKFFRDFAKGIRGSK